MEGCKIHPTPLHHPEVFCSTISVLLSHVALELELLLDGSFRSSTLRRVSDSQTRCAVQGRRDRGDGEGRAGGVMT